MKKNDKVKIVIGLVLLLTIIGMSLLINTRIERREALAKYKEKTLIQIEKCNKNESDVTIDCSRIDKIQEHLEDCEKEEGNESVPYMYEEYFSPNIIKNSLLIMVLVIGGLSVFNLSKLKNNKQKLSSLKQNYIYSLILPCFALLSFIIVAIMYKGNFSLNDVNFKGNYFLYIITILISSLLFGLYYVNLAYIAFYKYKNYIVNFIIFAVLFVLIETMFPYLIIEVFLNYYLKLNIPFDAFYTSQVFGWMPTNFSYLWYLVSGLFYFLTTYLIVNSLYSKKKKRS